MVEMKGEHVFRKKIGKTCILDECEQLFSLSSLGMFDPPRTVSLSSDYSGKCTSGQTRVSEPVRNSGCS
jgi:hypothetical protein